MENELERVELELLSDSPIESSLSDGLGFDEYATAISGAIWRSEDSITIGVFGGWGSGKTSLMKLIKSKLEDHHRKDILTIWFNAWQFEGEEDPLLPLCSTLVAAVKEDKALAADGGHDLVTSLRSLIYGLAVKGKFEVPLLGGLEVQANPKEMIDREERLTNAIIERSLRQQALSGIEKGAASIEGRRIVVFVDDLDRCFPARALALLEGIKLVLSQPGFVFVLGLDRRTISGYVTDRYKKAVGIDGDQYLDKLFQLPFQIPDYSPLLPTFADGLIRTQLGEEVFEQFRPLLRAIGPLCRDNPRAIKRFLNSLLIDHAIASSRIRQSDNAEIPISHIGFARALEMHWPLVAETIRYNEGNICDKLIHLTPISDRLTEQLEQLALDNSGRLRTVYDSINKDRLLRDVLLSAECIEWLKVQCGRPQDLWPLLDERVELPLHMEKSHLGEVFRIPRRFRVADRRQVYSKVLGESTQADIVRQLWPADAEIILEFGVETYWEEIGWQCEDGMVGRVLGVMKHHSRDDPIVLMEFNVGDNLAFVPIGTTGVEQVKV